MRLYLNDCGVVCPLGRGRSAVARALFSGASHAFREDAVSIPERSVQVGAIDGEFPPPPPVAAAYDCRNNRMMWAALAEIRPAVEACAARYGVHRIAVVLGSSTSGIAEGEIALSAYRSGGVWPGSYHYRQQEPGTLAVFAARALGLEGPAYTVATACSSSGKVFASARRLIRSGLVDAAVVGGADSLCRMTLNGFHSLEALSKSRCNPFSAHRDGITIGEGAAAFLLSAEPGPVELLGVGESSDAHHVTAPDPEGEGARAAMAMALSDAGLTPADIAYVNLHGTATPLNDAMESRAMAALFPASTPCSSTKGMTGHMLGATGGVEAAFLWLTLNPETNAGLLPPHLWDGCFDDALPRLNLIAPGTPLVERGRSAMLSNSFGFGGSNVSLVLGRA
ncbi:beta-ketoacyl-[acyl-carrier-protein] synthase family protein [Telmatospirillum siberiense]|uniref:Beta-ketoacyl-[acyl-carrier-protein] synthase II n=1 Tax=Telmatospirillum siberiense TaxID=382514 RepID=A0A2N3PW33_9PROT|nr:beta-ketoacyl-[acyl-carrier-protein] synthase family protein [Telmatospirillum siberiense]PKU24601.1 beta-ketoacyl-[acyl-carrier-protein] synthase II [Telmatospirillum siberiense]